MARADAAEPDASPAFVVATSALVVAVATLASSVDFWTLTALKRLVVAVVRSATADSIVM